jgi:hypothetical protein
MYEFLQKGTVPHALSAAVLPDNRGFTESSLFPRKNAQQRGIFIGSPKAAYFIL